MNKILTLLALAVLTCIQPMMAEEEDGPQKEMTQAQKDQFHKQLFEAKVAELAFQLKMTDGQKLKFTPIYSRYSNEMRTIFHNTRTRGMKDEAQKEKTKMMRQQQAQTVRLKYFDEFSKVLSPDQMSKLYTAEDAIQKKLRARRMEAQKKQGH